MGSSDSCYHNMYKLYAGNKETGGNVHCTHKVRSKHIVILSSKMEHCQVDL